jgi:hypothetical protein
MTRAMRAVLCSLALPCVLAASVAHASSPEFPICDADPQLGSLVVDVSDLGPSCPVRWLQPTPRDGGVRFELRAPDGALIHDLTVIDPAAFAIPERRHECDGSVVDTTRTLSEYTASFSDAAPGDQVRLLDADGTLLAQGTFGDSTCPAIDFTPAECQVCGPDVSPGCADAGAGGRGLGTFVAIALGAILLRRRR